MRPSEALREKRDQALAILRRYGAEDVRVFGSVARATDRDGSDLDLLVRFAPGTSLLDFSALHLDLEDLLGCRVEVVAEKALRGPRGEGIRHEAREL
jgi:predicted nucleotidyltransferase